MKAKNPWGTCPLGLLICCCQCTQLIFTARIVCEGYVFTRVCHSVHRGGSASVHAGIPHPPRSRHPPPGADPPSPGSRHPPPPTLTPPEQTPPRGRHHTPGSRHPPAHSMLGDTVNAWAVCILLECKLIAKVEQKALKGKCECTRLVQYTPFIHMVEEEHAIQKDLFVYTRFHSWII